MFLQHTRATLYCDLVRQNPTSNNSLSFKKSCHTSPLRHKLPSTPIITILNLAQHALIPQRPPECIPLGPEVILRTGFLLLRQPRWKMCTCQVTPTRASSASCDSLSHLRYQRKRLGTSHGGPTACVRAFREDTLSFK